MNKKYLIGCLELSFAQFCIGANIIFGKTLISIFPIYSLLLIRFVIGFMIAALCILPTSFQETKLEYQSLSFRDWILIFLQALCGGFLFNVFVLYGLQYTTATVTGIINSAVPALVAIFSFFILREKLTFNKAFAIFLCIVGIAVLSLGKSGGVGQSNQDLWGIFLVLLAIIPEAMFTIFAKLLKKPLTPMATTLLVNFFNALLFIPLAMTNELFLTQAISLLQWLQVFLYGLSGGILFFVFWYRGLKHISANTAALFMGVMPVSTTLLAILFLSETLNVFDAIGMICVTISIFFGSRQRLSVAKTTETLANPT